MPGRFHLALQWWFAWTTPAQMPTTTTARERLRKSQLLSILAFWSFILSAPILLENLQYGLYSQSLLNAALFEALVFLAIFLNRLGHMEMGGYVYIFAYISQITWGMLAVQREDGIGILWGWAHYVLAPIIAGLLLPFWSPIVFGLVNYAIIVWIFVVDSRLGFFTVILRHTGSNNFLVHAAITMMSAAIAGMFYSHSLKRAIAQADRAVELEQAHAELSAANAKLEHLATIDPITGLLNHRALNTQLAQEITRANRTGAPLSVIFGDIDHFKHVNDMWGHQTGDEVLAHVAGLLRDGIRANDTVARYGGEEFVILLPGQPIDAALQSAERLRHHIATTPLVTNERSLAVTMSLGVATFPDHATAADMLLSCADASMYCAKHSGRNCVCSSDDVQQRVA